MVDCLRCCDALVWVLRKQLIQYIFARLANLLKEWVLTIELLLDYGAYDLVVIFAVEGRPSSEHDVHDAADGPDVALVRVRALDDLGRDVVRCSLRQF